MRLMFTGVDSCIDLDVHTTLDHTRSALEEFTGWVSQIFIYCLQKIRYFFNALTM